jgi:AhpD family alkylhydroperoxidase
MDLHEFRASRRRKTDSLLKEEHRDLKRFFALDSAAYRDLSAEGGLDARTKDLLGLVASTVLRCNDCIAYHCDECVKAGWKKAELLDALSVALVVGGSITIPHIRTVWEVVEQLYEEQAAQERAKGGHPALQAAAAEVKAKVEEREVEAGAMLGLPDAAKGRRTRKRTEPAPPAAVPPPAPPAPAPPPPPATPKGPQPPPAKPAKPKPVREF